MPCTSTSSSATRTVASSREVFKVVVASKSKLALPSENTASGSAVIYTAALGELTLAVSAPFFPSKGVTFRLTGT